MPRHVTRTLLLAFAATPFLFAFSQQDGQKKAPTCEEVFANIKVFKGVPASDLIPAMEFMSASMKYQCTDCHDPKNYSVDTRTKETARRMVLMQRDINAKNFNNRTEVTCMTCHRGAEHPVGTPIPDGVVFRHPRITNPPKPETLLAAHTSAVGNPKAAMVFTGTLTAPNDETHKVETKPLELIQAGQGKFRLVAGDRKIGSTGKQTWYGTAELFEEPAFVMGRIGRAWRGDEAFTGLAGLTISGKDTVSKADVVVVRGNRADTSSLEELSFDAKTNLLVRFVNVRRSSLGNVVMAIDYSNYKTVAGVKVPMKVVVSFAGGEQWIMDFKSAKADPSIKDDAFKVPQG